MRVIRCCTTVSEPPRGVTLLDTPIGQRVLATSEYPKKLASMQHERWGGRSLRVIGTTLA